MTGDQDDIRERLRLTLPGRWFGDTAPVLDGFLSGLSAGWAKLHSLLIFVISQSRVITATGEFLEIAAKDYLSNPLPRRLKEDDGSYRVRVLTAMRRLGATRQAIIDAGAAAGYRVEIFEAAQPVCTGAYNVPGHLAWNTIGAWGSLQMSLESLIIAYPEATAYEDELRQNLALATPAGGASWLRVVSGPVKLQS